MASRATPGALSTSRAALRGRVRASDRVGPVLLVGLVLLAFIGVRLHTYRGDATGFVQFGGALTLLMHAPPDAYVASRFGYDGQYFWRQALDPFVLHRRTRVAFDFIRARYRTQRVAYPALAAGLALGSRAALPWTLLLINVVAVLALTAAAAAFMRARGRSGWWALAVGLSPGLILATLRDLSDPLATAALAGGLIAWCRERRGWATGLLTLAVLTREPMVLGVLGVALGALLAAHRAPRGERVAVLGRAAPVVLVPVLALGAWEAYLTVRFDGRLPASSTPKHQFGNPLNGLFDAMSAGLHTGGAAGAWNFAYLALVLAAIVLGLLAVVRRRTPLTITAAALALAATFEQYHAHKWSYTRATAPLFVMLALLAVADRRRVPLFVASAAALLTLLIPLAFSASGGA